MKKIISLLLTVVMLIQCMSLLTFATAEEEEPLKILFIGNSATYYNDMPEAIFAPMCEAAGYNVEVTSITKGSYYLRKFASSNDTFGAKVTAALNTKKYDYVVIQELTTRSLDVTEEFYSSVRIMTEKIRENGAEPVLYATIPKVSYDNGYTPTTYAYATAATSQAIADELGIKIAHAGLAVQDLMTSYPELTLHHTDNAHPGPLGSFVIASSIFATIFEHDPTEVDFNGEHDADTAAILKSAAAKWSLNEFIAPDEYKTTSEGVGIEYTDYGINNRETVVLSKAPTAPVISSGISGTKGQVASAEYDATALTDAQKADIADTGYGISVIGIEHMYQSTSYDWETSIANAIDGDWSGSASVARMHFGDARYDLAGNADENGKYQALITLNFGTEQEFGAIGFFSNGIYRVPGVCEVFVSNDAKDWTRVPSACWNGITGVTLTDLGGTTPDFATGAAAENGAIFSMDNTKGQYIRVGIIRGTFSISDIYSDDQMINPRELVVYGAIDGDEEPSVPSSGMTFAAEDNYTTTAAPSGIPRTIEAWVKVDADAPDTRLGIIAGNYISNTYADTMLDLEIRTNGNPYLYWRAGTNTSVKANFTDVDLRTGAWTHVAIVSTATDAKCYINGELKQTVEGTFADFDVSGLSQLMVGGDFRTGNAQYLKNTTLGAVSMYSESRSAEQIAKDYIATDYTDDALLLAYDFSNDGNERLKDYSANSNHLGYSNTADSSLDEKYIEMTAGMTFDNSNGLYNVGTLAAVPHTFEAEVYFPSAFDSAARGGVIVGNYGGGDSCINLEIYTSGRLRYYWIDANGDDYAAYFDIGAYCGEWVKLAVTHDFATGTVKGYLNGELVDTVTDKNVGGGPAIFDGFVLGGDLRSGNAQYFKGNLKSLAIYSDIRTDDEIAADAISYGTDDLILHYDLSEYSYTDRPDVVTDLAGNNDAVYDRVWIDGEEIETDYAYSFAVVGDTQCLNDFYPEYFQTLYDWIIDNKETKNIQYVFGLGDITNQSLIREWDEAVTAFDKLSDAGIPYSVVRGNHDSQTTTATTKLQFNAAMAESKYASEITEEQRMNEDELENTYRVFTVGDEKFVSITLDYEPTDEELAWASSVCEEYSDHKIIVSTHSYLSEKGVRFDTGENMFDKFVKQYKNIVLVLCGHDASTYIRCRKDLGVHGNTVTQILTDAQTEEKNRGALGMVTMLYFSKDGECVEVEHYSTVRDQYFLKENQFTMTWNELVGDVDLDYDVNVFDAMTLLSASVNKTELARGDVNCDGKITVLDVLKVFKQIVK